MDEPREITESFRLDRVLKSSRSAIVFQATDPGTGKVVAIKLIPPAGADQLPHAQARFLTAMEAVAVLCPPGFPSLLDCGFTPDGSAFMVMEFVEGSRLDALAAPSAERILHLVRGVAASLEKLADKNVAHGNLRPDNLLAVRAGEREGVAILGFGTAAFHGPTLAEGGGPEAAPSFVAPERLDPATATADVDWRSDLYALALTTCSLLGAQVGEPDATAPTVTLPPEVRQNLQDPVVLRAILEQALRRDPEARPTTLEEFGQALEVALEGVPGHRTEIPAIEREEAAVPAPPLPAARSDADAGPPPATERVDTGPVAIDPLSVEAVHGVPPEVFFSEPEELPDAVEVPTPVPEPLPEPAEAIPAEPQPEAGPPPAAPTPSRPRRRSRRGVVLGVAAAAAVLLAATAALVISQRGRSSPQPRAAVRTTRPPTRPTVAAQPTAQPSAALQLQNAEAAIALGDLVAARQALDSITPEQLETLSPTERERYASLRATYDAKVAQTLTRALAGSLASGNLRELAETVRSIPKADEARFARNDDLLAALEEARRALNVQALMQRAQRQGDWEEVLQQASVLVALVPRYRQAADLRERAAATLEGEADSSAAKGNFTVAVARLEAIRRSWPERRGITAHIERLKADHAIDQQMASVLATAGQAEKDNVPEKGLAALATVSPPPRWRERIRQVRAGLSAQLQRLDAAPPTVALVPGIKLEYKKNEPGTITVRIVDDHAVKSARLFARLEGSVPYVELPLNPKGGGEYEAEISPTFHKNGTVEFYITATDFSDHSGQLGSASEPLKLKRHKWWPFGG
jgi:serine/threonine protein kinase